MTFLAAFVLTVSVAALLVVAGYAVAGFCRGVNPAARLLAAPLLGLGLLLWSVSVVNLGWPLAGGLAWACGWMIPFVLLVPRLRRQFAADVREFAQTPGPAAAVAGGAGGLIAIVLLPFLQQPDLVFFDGTGNHDSFFWISGASYLQHYTYLSVDPAATAEPAHWWARVILGLQPHWGRMGTEGVLALVASILQRDPVEIALPVMTALLVPWLAAVLSLARELGWQPRGRRWLLLGCFLQPLFLFSLFNGNYPNLFGAICGGGLLVATAQLVSNDAARRHLGLCQLPLLLHAVLVTYPEIAPFVGLPAALVLLRHAWRGKAGVLPPRRLAHLALALGAGLLLNPFTTLRAAHGFTVSFQLARGDEGWRNLFADVSVFSYVPGWLTLSIDTVDFFDPWLSAGFTVLLLWGVVYAWRRSRDSYLAAASLAGFALLAAYTAYSGFNYGWQKTAQFAAVPLATWYPFGIMSLGGTKIPAQKRRPPDQRRALARRLALALMLAPAIVAVWDLAADARKSATRKLITQPMLDLGSSLETHYAGQPVLVDGRTFAEPFFQSMWASYVCRPAAILVPADAGAGGGYLAAKLGRYDRDAPPPGALGLYVAREWADQYRPSETRLAGDRIFALIPQSAAAGASD